jgi:hypothetical protein
MDGPVVQAAKLALEQKDVTPVLKWVQKTDEAQIKAAFAKSLVVRAQGADARDLADLYFFETLVRVHRAGEGAPYTGIKPARIPVEAPIAAADKALESGSADKVANLVAQEAAEGIRRRFAEVREKQPHADHNVEAGRAYVAAYVDYVHYVEGLYRAVHTQGDHHEPSSAETAATHEHRETAPAHNH